MRFKVSPVLCEKIALRKKVELGSTFSHFACEIMIWPIRMQLMTHYHVPEMIESLMEQIDFHNSPLKFYKASNGSVSTC